MAAEKKSKKEPKPKLSKEARAARRQAAMEKRAEKQQVLADEYQKELEVAKEGGPRAVGKYRRLCAVNAERRKLLEQLRELGVENVE